MKRHLLLSAIIMIAVISCKKKHDDKPVDQPGNTTDIELKRITAFPWTVYRLELLGSDVWNSGLVKACEKDNSYRFNRDSILMTYENANICSGNPDSTGSHWQFYENKTKLIGDLLGNTDTAGIIALEDSLMKLSVNYQGNPMVIFFKKY